MEIESWWCVLAPLAMIAAGVLLFYLYRVGKPHQPLDLAQMQALFKDKRPELQTAFFAAASTSGKPRGLRWKNCQWHDAIEWVRDKQTGQTLALVGVTISFEAIEGGDMEGVEAVGNLRDASAVFFFDREWRTAGRVIFNLGPAEAVEHFKQGYERI
jgi:hypothetical protein